VGQTAFVLESHKLRVSAHIMNEEGGQEILENRLVCTHVYVYIYTYIYVYIDIYIYICISY
jgi:hypothetical protein